MKNIFLRLPTFLFAAALACVAHADEPVWLKCRLEPTEAQLSCYQDATERYVADTAPASSKQEAQPQAMSAAETAPPPAVATNTWKLDQLWPLQNELSKSTRLASTFLQYKRNYFLLTSINSPSSAANSPNPANRAFASYQPLDSELKFQVSLKAPLPFEWPWGDTVWFAYTQQSNWQAFKSTDSRPFRESNYEPELIFLSHRFADAPLKIGSFTSPLTPRFLNLAYVHQSNGQSLPRSRSWNRLTAQLGSEYRFPTKAEEGEPDKRIAVLIRPWWRVPEKGIDDDNSDIVKYLGHGDIEINYWRDRDLYSVLLRERAVQLEWSFPLSEDAKALNLHLQYFNGYGQSLIDYNHKLHSIGLGVSIPY